MSTVPTSKIKNQFGPGYAVKNTADLTDADVLWSEKKVAKKKATKKKAKK